jgi:hypothetical protein
VSSTRLSYRLHIWLERHRLWPSRLARWCATYQLGLQNAGGCRAERERGRRGCAHQGLGQRRARARGRAQGGRPDLRRLRQGVRAPCPSAAPESSPCLTLGCGHTCCRRRHTSPSGVMRQTSAALGVAPERAEPARQQRQAASGCCLGTGALPMSRPLNVVTRARCGRDVESRRGGAPGRYIQDDINKYPAKESIGALCAPHRAVPRPCLDKVHASASASSHCGRSHPMGAAAARARHALRGLTAGTRVRQRGSRAGLRAASAACSSWWRPAR